MKRVSADFLREMSTKIFTKCGATIQEARVISEELVRSSLMGVDSHGISSIAQYVDEVARGIIKPGAPLEILKDTGSTLIVDCGFNFGISQAMKATAMLKERAEKFGIACVVGERSHHIGRLGTYVQDLAERGLIGIGFACGSTKYRKNGDVAPFGGKEGRLSTNPIAYAVPGGGEFVLFDITTAAIPKQKLKILHRDGLKAPVDSVIDSDGHATQDPGVLFIPSEDHGAILPFGGWQAHKGYGLALLAEILSGFLSGQGIGLNEIAEGQYSNSFCFIALDPNAFCGTAVFTRLMSQYREYIKSSSPIDPAKPVLFPGEVEKTTCSNRLEAGIPVSDTEWKTLLESADRIGVAMRP